MNVKGSTLPTTTATATANAQTGTCLATPSLASLDNESIATSPLTPRKLFNKRLVKILAVIPSNDMDKE